MIINRHNYEEFFILYLDNELSSQDRGRLEFFIEQNPDLREELDMLQQSRLVADPALVFKGKEALMKSAADCNITLYNYTEWLLLYVDNELTLEQVIAVENFAIANPVVKAELDILQKTKLQPEESIIYFNKESLYRREDSTRRVVPLRWWRIAAAAVLLFAISVTGFLVLNRTDKGDLVEIKTPETKKTAPKLLQETNQAIEQPVLAKTNNEQISKIKKQETAQPKNSVAVNQKSLQTLPIQVKQNEESIASENKNNLPVPAYNPNMQRLPERVITLPDISKESLTDLKEIKPIPVVTPSDIKPLYTSADQSEKKTKFRGLLRKITRTFEKTTNIKATDDDDRLLVAGLAFRL